MIEIPHLYDSDITTSILTQNVTYKKFQNYLDSIFGKDIVRVFSIPKFGTLFIVNKFGKYYEYNYKYSTFLTFGLHNQLEHCIQFLQKEIQKIDTLIPTIDLGTANGWENDGIENQLVQRCYKLNHYLKQTNLGRCYNEYKCNVCNIKWRVDSSD